MEFTIDKILLQSAITTASRASSAKSAIPALEGLLIDACSDCIKISGYDLKIGIITTVPANVVSKGAIVLNARLFVEIIRKLPDNVVSFSSNDNFVTKIECGKSEFQILGTSAADYPDLPSADYQKSLAITERYLKNMIAQTNFAVSDNESRPIQTGALFETENNILTIIAIDGFRLALRREQLSKSDRTLSFVVPGGALSEVEKILTDNENLVSIMLSSKHIMFVIGGTILISRRLEGEFYNYKHLIALTEKYSIEADRRAVVDAVERVSLIISDKLKSPVRCTFADGVLKLLSSTVLGRASDECAVKGDGEELEIGFNNKYLLDALKAAPADRIRFNIASGTAPCFIIPADASNNFLYMTMPVRLKVNES
jgi:DNA polymerase-3 subunit beta